tara:strand:+ start:25 stop:462 length:438 start_codon:yes stop_codon:yes gene_type:complete
MAMINKKSTFLILALLFALLSIPIIGNKFEGFVNLTPGNYPLSVDEPILNDYPHKQKMGVSTNTSEDNYPYYPVFGSSYGQYTNNVRYWETPDNGMCSRAEFCGGLYNNKKLDIPKSPNQIPFSSPQIRVNYYGSDKLICPTTNV